MDDCVDKARVALVDQTSHVSILHPAPLVGGAIQDIQPKHQAVPTAKLARWDSTKLYIDILDAYLHSQHL